MLLLRFKTVLVGAAATLAVAAVALIAAVPGAGAAPNSTTLVRGWNNVAYLGTAKAPADALSGIAGQYSSVYRWDATTQSYALYAPGAPAFANTITQLQPGDTLWVNYTQNSGSFDTGTATGTTTGTAGPGVISVPASAFMPMDDLAIYEKSYNQIGPVGTDAASKRYFAPISLPNGVSPTSMTANFVGSGATVDVRLDYTPLSNGSSEASVFKIAEVLSSSGSSPQTAQAFTHTVDNSANVYFLVVDLTGGSASQLNGVSIAYTQN